MVTQNVVRTVCVLALLGHSSALLAQGTPSPPWQTKQGFWVYWHYSFEGPKPSEPSASDGNYLQDLENPTIDTPNEEGIEYSYSGEALTIANTNTDDKTVNLSVTVPNTYLGDKEKWFFYAFTYTGVDVSQMGASAKTDDARSTEVGKGKTYTQGQINGWTHFLPQPAGEILTITATVPSMKTLTIDNLQVGSICVPEPSALLALGVGVAGLYGLGRRRRPA